MIESDVVIIGGGPGGYVAAIKAAQLGLKVVLVEERALGGTCLNWGCVPTKVLIESVKLLNAIRRADECGISVADVRTDFKKMMARKEMVVRELKRGLQSILLSYNVRIVVGAGSLLAPTEVAVAGEIDERIETRSVIIATGTVPATISVTGAEGSGIMDSKDILSLKEVPRSLAIIGAGAIGMEFSTIFAGLGSSVTILEQLPRVLPQEDTEVSSILERVARKTGIDIHTNAQVTAITDVDGGKSVSFTIAGKPMDIWVEGVLLAVGVYPNTERLGLDKLGLATEGGFIKVNGYLETSLPRVYAVGDVVGGLRLAHKAFTEGETAAENIAGKQRVMDYRVIPRCIYTIPEVAAVGISEAEATEAGYKVRVGRFPFVANSKATILGKMQGLVKVVADGATEQILGVHICGNHATELIHQAVLIMKMGGLVEDLATAIYAHPTMSEAVKEAALDNLGFAIHIPAKRGSTKLDSAFW